MRWMAILLLLLMPLAGCLGGADDDADDMDDGMDVEPEPEPEPEPQPEPEPVNLAPVADVSVSPGEKGTGLSWSHEAAAGESVTFTLDASGSSDPEGEDLTYTWSIAVSGVGGLEAVEVPDEASVTVDVEAPALVSFELTLSDGGPANESVEGNILLSAAVSNSGDVPTEEGALPGSTARTTTTANATVPVALGAKEATLDVTAPVGTEIRFADPENETLTTTTVEEADEEGGSSGTVTISSKDLSVAGQYILEMTFPACPDEAGLGVGDCGAGYEPGSWSLEGVVRMT